MPKLVEPQIAVPGQTAGFLRSSTSESLAFDFGCLRSSQLVLFADLVGLFNGEHGS
jgi:hypothetical protein